MGREYRSGKRSLSKKKKKNDKKEKNEKTCRERRQKKKKKDNMVGTETLSKILSGKMTKILDYT